MQSIKHAPLTVAVETLSFGLNAAGDSYIDSFSAFMDTSAGVTVGILNYMGSEIEQQDPRLNLSYKAVIQTLETGPRVQLRDAQHLWTKLRDADCTLLGSLTGGGSDSINRASCVLDMTKERAEYLAWLGRHGQYK